MFSHIMVGANDLEASKKFYDAVLGKLGAKPGDLSPNLTGQKRYLYLAYNLLIEQIYSSYLMVMLLRLYLFTFFCSCTSMSPPNLISTPPLKKSLGDEKQETIYTLGYMSEYDIWEFLKEKPTEKEVLETFGIPD